MLNTFLVLCAALSVGLEPERNVRVFLEPMDIHAGSDSLFLAAIYQIECEGDRLYFRGGSEPFILITDLNGKVMGSLGGKGGHPSEFGEAGVLAMAVKDETVAAIDKHRRFVRFFVGDSFDSYIRLVSYHPWATHATSNIFAFTKDRVVVPALSAKHLAIAYQRSSKANRSVGELLELGNDRLKTTDLNATLWCYRKGFWYAAHKFFPVITVYDDTFTMVNQYQINHDVADGYIAYLSNFHADENFTRPQPLITDVKWFGDSLFLMMQGRLFQLDPRNGTVARVISFYGKGEHFGPADGKRVTLPLFAFSTEGTLYTAHPGLLWGHDFWRVPTPFFDQAWAKTN